MQIWTTILAAFAFLGFFLSVVFIMNKEGIIVSNRIFAFLILFVSLMLTDLLFLTSGLFKYIPHLMGITFPLHFLIGPLFYFYIRSHVGIPFKFRKIELLHFVPFLLAFYIRSDFYLLPEDAKLMFLAGLLEPDLEAPFSLFQFSTIVFKILFNAGYILYGLKLINMAQAKNSEFRWLRYVSLFFLTFWGLYFTSFIPMSVFRTIRIDFDLFVATFLAIYLFSIGIYSFLKKDLVSGIKALEILKNGPISQKYIEQKDHYMNKLKNLMEEDKVYLDPELSLEKLSKISRIPRHQLSMLINREFTNNYNDFINKYRVKNAEDLLNNGAAKRFSLLGIGIESGFNSKKSFIRAFKKFTSKTPSQYLAYQENKNSVK